MNIPFNPDQGGLGPQTNAQAVAQAAAAFAAWAAIPSSTATHVNAGSLAVDVDETNFLPFLNPAAPDGLSAIVFDEDGAIFTLLFGADSGVLGFAGPEWINVATGDIIEGVAFMNGGALLGPDAFPIAEFLSVQVHEFGHYQNLAHTVVNGQVAGFADHRGPSPNNTFDPPAGGFAGRIETMYPFLFVNGGMATPHPDDIAIFSFLYPEPSFATTTGTIAGTIIAPNNLTRLTGVNVIARNVANPYDDAVSAISSDFTDDFSSGSPLVGTYTLRGLTPGASYAIYVDRITNGGFSTPPRTLPGPEEFYNGAAESNDAVTDVPNVFTAVSAGAGATVSGIDVIFNRGPLVLGDDTFAEVFPPFQMKICGETFDSLFINSNGSLTFGEGSTAFGESAAAMLTGPTRIAGLWDDLNPAAGGTVTYSESNSSLTVAFTNVPEFSVGGANTFSFTLFAPTNNVDGSRSRFNITYGAMSAADGAAGYSCGRRITSGFELERDLSSSAPTINSRWEPAIYEVFTTLDNDLDNRTLRFTGTSGFVDGFEPNNTPASQTVECLVEPPFSTANSYTEIKPLGNDVDFFTFNASAGDILAIETVPGNQAMDTVVGIFDAAGNLLLADDDGGVGLLSRLFVQILVPGRYMVGVSTFPDLGFTGAGGDFGRYVLTINRYRGTIIPVGDDSSVQVPLTTFTFPFQGASWSSVFVNGNGNLTFGAANGDFTESVPEFLAGPPRIAPLWDDLNPVGGLVIAEEKDHALTVHFVSVPEFLATGTNYFSVALNRTGAITIDYGATNRSDALVGVTEGMGAANPGPIDLSQSMLNALGTSYETFIGSFTTYGGVDLSFRRLRFRN